MYKFLICLLAVLILGSVFSQDTIAEESDIVINIYASVQLFPNPAFDSVVLLEFPFSLKRNEFSFFQQDSTDSNWYSRVFAQVDIYDMSGRPVDSVQTYFAMKLANKREMIQGDVRIFNKLSIFLPPGSYTARLTIIDVNNKNEGDFFFPSVVIQPIVNNKLTVAGLSLAYNIRYVGEDSSAMDRMYKNGYLVYTNPTGIFSTKDSTMYIYAELYNLEYDQANQSKMKIYYSVLNEDSTLFIKLGEREIEKIGSSHVIAEQFDIRSWPDRLFHLRVIAVDDKTGMADSSVIPFRILKPVQDWQVTQFHAKQNDPYAKLDLKEKLQLVDYLIDPQERQTLKNLTDSGKVNFLRQFWRERDPIKSTTKNEDRDELIRRYEYSNLNFSTEPKKDNGWRTDQGRVYMTMGTPDEIDDEQSPMVGNAYQVWYYRNISEGKFYVFEDWVGNHEYRIVHSNVDGEVYSANWEDYLRDGPGLENR